MKIFYGDKEMRKNGFFGTRTALGLAGASALTMLATSPAKADQITDRIIQNVIQNILENVRDQIQSRRLTPVGTPGRMQFTGEDASLLSNPNDPFAAMAYAKSPVYTKAPPAPAAPAVPTYMYGLNAIGSADWSNSNGITTNSYGVTGAFDFTKIGVFSQYDSLTFIFTGGGVFSNAVGLNSDTGVGAGTIAYTNGGFSADFTVSGTWTNSRFPILGVITDQDSTGLSYSPNVQYKFEFPNGWFIEPTVGVSYSESFDANFANRTGHSTEVHGGARFGTDWNWNGVRIQPSLKLEAFSIVDQSAGGGVILINGVPTAVGAASGISTGEVGGRGSGKLNFLWTPTFSTFIEAHGSGIGDLTSYGTTGGFRFTF